MDLRRHFPATAWIWRQVSSRWARRVWLVVGIALILLTTALRIHAVIFEYRVSTILSGMAQLRLDETAKSEMLARVPALHPGLPDGTKCHPDECYSVEFRNWPGEGRLSKLTLLLGPMGRWLGARYWRFTAVVALRDGKVYYVSYHLLVDNFMHKYPGFVMIHVDSARGPRAWESLPAAQMRDYQVTHYFKWPDLNTAVVFTPAAPPELVRRAFDVQLDCLWSLRGCRTAAQVLPFVEGDQPATTRPGGR